MEKTEEEHKYTSTGIKFWRHRGQLESYRGELGRTIISTHISPEGSCNLKCSYCSVAKRDKHYRIELDVIKDYILKLKSRGLKAVIITGGGEPTLYPHFNELISWIKEQNLSVALITNGTGSSRVKVWDAFSWVRVSLNFFEGWEEKIGIPKINGIVGCSMIYVGQSLETFEKVARFADKINAEYIRLLPNCLLNQEELLQQHHELNEIYKKLDSKKFFHQHKIHGTPCSDICHQAYFRPYLSEVNGGTVYPCDSLVLNECCQHFADEFHICKADEVLDFLDGKIKMRFNPQEKCSGCVFTDNIKLLDDWKKEGKNCFEVYSQRLKHEEFV